MPDDTQSSFGRTYWTDASQYRKFEDYAAALAALRAWYQGLFRLVGSELGEQGRALDAGCGHGAIVYELGRRGFDAHGFDPSAWMIEQAREANPQAADRFAVGELPSTIPFDGSFDLITALEVFEHVPDPVTSLRALGERLAPGGRVVATTPNLRPGLPWWDAERADPTHVSVHEPRWWRRALIAAGLEPRRVSTFLAVPLLWRAHPVFARWLQLGPTAGPGVLIVASAAAPDTKRSASTCPSRGSPSRRRASSP